MRFLNDFIISGLKQYGYEVQPIGAARDMDADFEPLYAACRPFTMTSAARMFALYKAVEYLVKAHIPGDIVETGVWKGGSAMLIARTLLHLGVTDRKIYLYDTYAGMSAPTGRDRKLRDAEPALPKWQRHRESDHVDWCYSPLHEVRSNMESTGYPLNRVSFVVGKVEDTLPSNAPERISLLRLDTDFYESTAQSLQHLYPRLHAGGVLLLDDYGSWEGAKLAVDEYFHENQQSLLLNRIDSAGRIGIKPALV